MQSMAKDDSPEPAQAADIPAGEAASILGLAVRRYQDGASDPWTTMILEAVDRRVEAAVRCLPTDTLLSADDLRQQLRAEVLTTARAIRLDADRWLARMLMERALRNVRRWARRQRRLDCVPLLDDVMGEPPPAVTPSVDIAVSREDLALLYRRHVLGEGWEAIAAATGRTPACVRRRASRTTARIRRQGERRVRDGRVPDTIRNTEGTAG